MWQGVRWNSNSRGKCKAAKMRTRPCSNSPCLAYEAASPIAIMNGGTDAKLSTTIVPNMISWKFQTSKSFLASLRSIGRLYTDTRMFFVFCFCTVFCWCVCLTRKAKGLLQDMRPSQSLHQPLIFWVYQHAFSHRLDMSRCCSWDQVENKRNDWVLLFSSSPFYSVALGPPLWLFDAEVSVRCNHLLN